MIHGLGSLSCLQESPLSSHARKLDFVTILTQGLSTTDSSIPCLGRKAFTDRFSCQGLFSFLSPPGNGRHMSQNDSSTFNGFAIHLERYGGGGQGPIQGFLLPHFVCRVPDPLGWRDNDLA